MKPYHKAIAEYVKSHPNAPIEVGLAFRKGWDAKADHVRELAVNLASMEAWIHDPQAKIAFNKIIQELTR